MPDALTAQEFQQFQEFIYQACGIRVRESKRILLSNRIRRRLRSAGIDNYQDYYRFLTSQAGRRELPGFLDAVTTNETSFFRTPKHFEWFHKTFIPEVAAQALQGNRPRRLRIWSAACSTGEEPYSLAICLARHRVRLRDWSVEVLGTDLSEQALSNARSGLYRSHALEPISATERQRFFQSREDDQWQIRADVQELVTFQSHNLMQPLRQRDFDCIFIRNVLIYFDRESKRKVVDNLIQALATGGYLVVGPTEGIFDMLERLTKISPFLYQKQQR